MALTPAEKQKRYRERKREQERLAGDPTDAIAKRSFSDFIQADLDSFQVNVLYQLEWAGINPDAVPTFEKDDDPDHDPQTDGPYRGSIGRAERMVSMLMDAGRGLAYLIRDYKREEIDRAIAEIEQADMTDPAVKKKALADIVRLTKMRERLDKDARVPMPQYEVKGE